jgi:hypothetical protein
VSFGFWACQREPDDRILRASRTEADVEGWIKIRATDLTEAVGYRSADYPQTAWKRVQVHDIVNPAHEKD